MPNQPDIDKILGEINGEVETVKFRIRLKVTKTVLQNVTEYGPKSRQITILDLPPHKQIIEGSEGGENHALTMRRSKKLCSIVKFSLLDSEGEERKMELFVADTHGIHPKHQTTEEQLSSFDNLFEALSEWPDEVFPTTAEVIDLVSEEVQIVAVF